MLVAVQSCFNSWNTKYFNNVMTTTDHVTGDKPPPPATGASSDRSQLNAPDEPGRFPAIQLSRPCTDIQRKNRRKMNNHYPAALSFKYRLQNKNYEYETRFSRCTGTDTVLQPPATIIASVRAGKESTPRHGCFSIRTEHETNTTCPGIKACREIVSQISTGSAK